MKIITLSFFLCINVVYAQNLICPNKYQSNALFNVPKLLKLLENNKIPSDKLIFVSKLKNITYRGKAVYTSIKEAIHNSRNGDFIFVDGGKYFERLGSRIFNEKTDLKIIALPSKRVELWNVQKVKLHDLKSTITPEHIYNMDFEKLQISTYPFIDLFDGYPSTSQMLSMELEKIDNISFKVEIKQKLEKNLIGAEFLGYINKAWTALNGTVVKQLFNGSKTILYIRAQNDRFKLNGFQGKGYGYFLNKESFIKNKKQYSIESGKISTLQKDNFYYVSNNRFAVSFKDTSNIIFSGIKVFGGSIEIENSQKIILDNIELFDPIPFFKFKKVFAYSDKNWKGKGLVVNGNNNRIQRSKIVSSWGDGISVQGNKNFIVNNKILDSDKIGIMASGISVDGISNEIIGNIISGSGRDGIDLKFAKKGKVSCNTISNLGGLTKDLGGVYTVGTDSKGLEISYNTIFDNKDRFGPGIYLDNKSSNYLVHHNLLYNSFEGIRINPPSVGHEIYHNTIATNRSAMSRARAQKGKIQQKDILTFRNLSFANVRGTKKYDNLVIDRKDFDFKRFVPIGGIISKLESDKNYYGAIDYREERYQHD